MEVLVITSRLLRLATESSMTWVTSLSTASGPAPGYVVMMVTIGMLAFGSRLIGSDV